MTHGTLAGVRTKHIRIWRERARVSLAVRTRRETSEAGSDRAVVALTLPRQSHGRSEMRGHGGAARGVTYVTVQ